MKRKMNLLVIVAIVFAMLLSFTSVAFAQSPQGQIQSFSTQGIESSSQSGKLDQIKITSDPKVNNGVPNVQLPNVQIQQAEKWVERKGFEVVGLLQKFVQPFAIAIFIICAMLSLVGSFGNSNLVGKGIVGMIISVLMYAIVLSAPEFIDYINAWLKS
ncbi:hypothetical protein ACFVS2_22045 [Brevibacillus sp. NPDC058079]|uniref:hypothetical protein n=1 Tax=Brevibacillus sp. NPDC058079 TaxID=3346330 RepID=UPI0036ECEE7B